MTLAGQPRIVVGVRGFTPSDAFAAVQDATANPMNLVLHFDGGSWAPVAGDSSSDPFLDLEISATRIAAVQDGQVLECDRSISDCLVPASWEAVPVASPGGDHLSNLCSDGSRFFATGTNSAFRGTLYARAGGTYVSRGSVTTSGLLHECSVLADGTVLAGGFGFIARFSPDGGVEQLPVAGSTSFSWWTVRNVGGRTFVGGDARRIVELLPDAGFVTRFDQGSMPKLRAMGGLFVDEVLAMGDDSAAAGTVGFDGTVWSAGSGLSAFLNVYDVTAVDSNHWFVAGQQLNSSGGIVGGVIFRGRR